MDKVLNEKLYEFLLSSKIIEEASLTKAYEESKKSRKDLSEILLKKDLIIDSNLGKIIADILSVPFTKLSDVDIPKEVLNIVPEIVAKKQKIIAYKKDAKGLHIATADPENNAIFSLIAKKSGLPVLVSYSTNKDVEIALSLYAKDISDVFEEIINPKISLQKDSAESEPQIIKIVATLISYAYQNHASDIHIEPLEKEISIRFRIDSVLHDVVTLPIEFQEPIVTRVKVMAKLRTDEHSLAQDGKIQFKIESENLDIRVSIAPTVKGEQVVLRLLSERSRQFSLPDLGVNDTDLEKIKKAYQKPYGMVLATGPTGCGKTTTMYAILKILNQRDVNIMTIEDPVEYDIEGVNQIQVNSKTGLTFATGLRSIVRQDPNIILVGEIRDQETAGIAVNSAMTGHLVLSTMHTNDAATAIPRLFDMGVEAFLIASSVNVIIGQRLVRKICMQCRISKEVEVDTFSKFFSNELLKNHFKDKKSVRLYEGKGCAVCHNTGFIDRIGIFEVMEINNEMKEAITNHSNSGVLKDTAVKYGMRTMIDDGLDKVVAGITTIEEIIRVTKE